ncbi:hypothetical protein O6H91_06G071300 [Diphasiastrum complanatum]|uniref:Uncharacterized protein n=1 Tax=Diphasiastrum complanatum TaxID=34168 RepID=A0ACC2DFS1_DIPCM|nr:hypothetical protein O6H91_Y325100 [Diphasiastrum complanatum]KAJ7552812.1 hypothetical protein O6H91_06G071300 [Diphasiastrum complanatum]
MAAWIMHAAVQFTSHNHNSVSPFFIINHHTNAICWKNGIALHWCRSSEVCDTSRVCYNWDMSWKGCSDYGGGVLLKKKSGKVRAVADSARVEGQEQKYEVRVCVNTSCRRSGALQTLDVLRSLAPPNASVESCSCLGRCGAGPNLVVLPAEIFVSHCNTASHVARLLEVQCGAYDHENNLKALALKQQGNAAFEHGNLSLAESLYSEAIQLRPSGGLHFLYANRSAVKLEKGDLESSLKDALEAVQLAPMWAGAYLRQGEAYTVMGKYAEALSVYAKACSFDTSLRRSKSFQHKVQKLEAACNTV